MYGSSRGRVVSGTMTSRRLLAMGLLVLPCLAAGGCSLVNSFGDVVPQGSESDSGRLDDSSAVDQTSPGSDTGTDTQAPSDAPASGNDSASDSTTPMQDSGVVDSADGGPPVQGGAIVVGGNQTGDGGFVLSVLDPDSGSELSREAMTVVAIHYDGLRDLWYLFENNAGVGGIFPAPNDPVKLHVRALDTNTGVWTEKSKTPVPAIESTDTVAVLNERLSYVAYSLNDAGNPTGGYALVLLDTSNPAAPAQIGTPTPLANLPTGTIGTRNSSNAGGTINLFHIDDTSCEGDGSAQLCEFDAVHVIVQASGSPNVSGTSVPITAVSPQGSEGVGSYLHGGPDDVIAFPPVNGAMATVQRFTSSASVPIAGSVVSFGIANPHLQRLAISECYSMAFVVGVPNDTQVYGVSLNGATSTILTADMGHSGQAVAYEPYTNTVIAPFKANGSFAISAFSVTGPVGTPVLTNRTNSGTWNPPSDLEPNFVGVREPVPYVCPP